MVLHYMHLNVLKFFLFCEISGNRCIKGFGFPAVWKVNVSASGLRREIEYRESIYFNLKMEEQSISTETTTKIISSNWFKSSYPHQWETS